FSESRETLDRLGKDFCLMRLSVILFQFLYWIAIMIDENLARLRAHRQNIERYRRLLETSLTVLERDFVERRIAEEESALNRLASDPFPVVLKMPRKAV